MAPATVDTVKRINIQNAPYAEKKNLIQSLVDKVIYSQEKLIFYLIQDVAKLQPFATDNFINQNISPLEFTISDGRIVITVQIVLRKYVNTVFDKSKNGVLTITDNNHLILKAFATAWRYREMYEECGDADTIIATEHISPRQFYRYLDIAYMNPDKINKILSGHLKINVNDLFQIAKAIQILNLLACNIQMAQTFIIVFFNCTASPFFGVYYTGFINNNKFGINLLTRF